MEIDVTRFVQENDMFDYAHSAFEGGPNAADNTWRAALKAASRYPYVTDENRDAFDSWCRDFGAWDREEITSWDNLHCTALLLQFVAGDARRMQDAAEDDDGAFDRLAYERFMEREGGALYCEDPTDADASWSFYMGH